MFINLREKRVTNPARPESSPVVFFQASLARGVFLLPVSLVKIEYAWEENAARVFGLHLTRVLTMRQNFAADNLTPLIFSRGGIHCQASRLGGKECDDRTLREKGEGQFLISKWIFHFILSRIISRVRWHPVEILEFCFHEAHPCSLNCCTMSVPGLPWTFLGSFCDNELFISVRSNWTILMSQI